MIAITSCRAIYQLAALVLLVATVGTGCGGEPGSDFLGKWENIKNPRDTMEIVRNGDQFLIIEGSNRAGAVLKDGSLEVTGMMGAIRLTHIKSSDTLTAPSLMGTKEYKRKK